MVRPVASKWPVSLGYRQKAKFNPLYIHRGVDYAVPSGTAVVATRGGHVTHVGRGGYGSAYGIQVVVKVGTIYCLYAHLSSASVRVGDQVKTGQTIGRSGATGNVTGPHLHYQENTKPPAQYTSDRNPQFLTWTDKPVDKMDAKNYPPKGLTQGAHILWLGQRLVAHGFSKHYKVGPTATWGNADKKNLQDFQKAQGWKNADADGYPGPETLRRLAADPKKPTPAPSAPNSQSLNVGTLNVIRWRLGTKNRGYSPLKKGKDYEQRVAGLAKVRKAMASSVLGTQESGQYKDGDLLSKKFGSKWKNILHGDNGDLTNAVHWESARRERLDSGKYTTAGAHHNWATWVLLRDLRGSGVIFLFVNTHLEYRARSTGSKPSEWDTLRGRQAKPLIEKAEAIAAEAAKKYKVKNVPIVFVGDFNQDDDDKHDIVGDVFTKAGYVDAEKVAAKVEGLGTTFNNMDPKKDAGRRLDRIFVPKGTKVGWMRTVAGYPHTDHNGVSANITLSNG